MDEQNCSNCAYFHKGGNIHVAGNDGMCVRYPPRLYRVDPIKEHSEQVGIADAEGGVRPIFGLLAFFPDVQSTSDWCGEWKLSPTMIRPNADE